MRDVGVEATGIFESRDDGATWSAYSRLAGRPGSQDWDDPSNQPPGHLGISAITADEKDPAPRVGDRAGPQPVRDDRRRQDLDAVHLPPTLMPLFAGPPRRLDLEAATVDDAIGRLDAQWPGLRDRLCDPSGGRIRQHIHVYVDRERAGLDTPLEPGSRVHVIAAISGG